MSTTTLHSVTLGNGPENIVILHGWGNTLEFWRPIGELLAPYAKVHLIDLPGFGKSPVPPKAWGVSDYANCVVEYLNENNIQKATLIGHSFGGRVCVILAASNPDLVTSLVLINAHGLPPKRSLEQTLRISYIKMLRSLIKTLDTILGTKLFQNWFAPKYGSRDYKAAGPLKETFLKVINEHLGNYAQKIKTRTLLLWGELDTETPLSIGKQYNTLIKNSELLVLEGKGHDCFMDVGGHLCVYHIKRFLGLGEKQRSMNE